VGGSVWPQNAKNDSAILQENVFVTGEVFKFGEVWRSSPECSDNTGKVFWQF